MNTPNNKIITSFFDKLNNQSAQQKLDLTSNQCEKIEQNIDFLALNESAKEAQDIANNDKKGDISLKKIYGISILIILILWVTFVVVFMMLQVCSDLAKTVSDTIIITLLTSATANILILPMVVLKYLFPNRGKE